MSDVFISYARQDLESARRLADALETQGWSVFWDRTIPAGKTWREIIGAELDKCRCLVVLWSKHAVASRWVLEEADHGLKRGILIPAFIDNVCPPLGFRSIQAADLSAWSGSQEDPALQSFLSNAAELLGGDPSAAAPRPKVEEERAAAEAHLKSEQVHFKPGLREHPLAASKPEPGKQSARFAKWGIAPAAFIILLGAWRISRPPEPGLYLLAAAKAGSQIAQDMVRVVQVRDGNPALPDRPLIFEQDVQGACFTRDVESGYRLEWTDLGFCRNDSTLNE